MRPKKVNPKRVKTVQKNLMILHKKSLHRKTLKRMNPKKRKTLKRMNPKKKRRKNEISTTNSFMLCSAIFWLCKACYSRESYSSTK